MEADARVPGNLLEYAKVWGYIVFTNDLDFGATLAASAASSPNVISEGRPALERARGERQGRDRDQGLAAGRAASLRT